MFRTLLLDKDSHVCQTSELISGSLDCICPVASSVHENVDTFAQIDTSTLLTTRHWERCPGFKVGQTRLVYASQNSPVILNHHKESKRGYPDSSWRPCELRDGGPVLYGMALGNALSSRKEASAQKIPTRTEAAMQESSRGLRQIQNRSWCRQ